MESAGADAGLAAASLGESTSEGTFGTGANSARIAPSRPYETPAKTKMSTPVAVNLSSAPDGLGVLAFRGTDAAKFLQGQLSADIEKLGPGASTLSGLHNPQGRVIALLAVVRATTEELFAVLPRDLASAVTQRLRKFVLRSKVVVEDASDLFCVLGSESATSPPGLISLAWGTRRLLLVPRDRLGEFDVGDPAALARWQVADITGGLPQVCAATSEAFVAQMLNLDLLGAIAFDKGCYTGQEVIARAHYRGRVKRRLQRWLNGSGVLLKPADTARTSDGRVLSVVCVAPRPDGQQEVLAVGNFAAVIEPAAENPSIESAGAQVSGPLPLPYSLPE
jgi:folate-binding protein YgfZ